MNEIVWDQSEIPFKDSNDPMGSYHIDEPDLLLEATGRLKQILDAKYNAADLEEIAAEQEHLTPEEQQMLYELLSKFKDLFDGTLGQWKETAYDIELHPDAQPYHAKAYPIPRVHLKTLRTEVNRLCKIGVLK